MLTECKTSLISLARKHFWSFLYYFWQRYKTCWTSTAGNAARHFSDNRLARIKDISLASLVAKHFCDHMLARIKDIVLASKEAKHFCDHLLARKQNFFVITC
jgi:hypothetical protein